MTLTATALKGRDMPLTAAVSFFGDVNVTEQFDEIVVPSTSASSEYQGSNEAPSTDLLKDSASHSVAFPVLPGASLLARILDAGHTLELRWLQPYLHRRDTAQQDLDDDQEHHGSDLSESPVRLRFAGEIIPSVAAVISTDASSSGRDHLELAVLTVRPFIIYHLTFDGPDFFHASTPLSKGWCLEQAITLPALLPNGGLTDPILFACPLASAGSGSSSQGLAVATKSGSIACFEWLSDERRFQESDLRSDQSFGSALRSWVLPSRFTSTSLAGIMSPTRYSSSSSKEDASNSETIISMTTDEDGMLPDCIFTLHRDRKLKAWSIATKSCTTIVSVPAEPQTMEIIPSTSTSADGGNAPRSTLLIGPQPRPLLRLARFSQANTQPFLLVYSPSANVQTSFFVVYSLILDTDGNLQSMTPIREIPCNFPLPTHAGQTELSAVSGAYSTSLTDFTVVHDSTTVPVLWTLWSESGTAVLRCLQIDKFDHDVEDVSSSATWIAVSPCSAFTTDSLDTVAAEFDVSVTHQVKMIDMLHAVSDMATQHADQNDPDNIILACKRGVAESILQHLFSGPPKFAANDIWASLLAYSHNLSTSNIATAIHVGRQNGESPAQIALDIVATTSPLQADVETGALQVEQYIKYVRSEWLRFTAICEEVRRSVIAPTALALVAPKHVDRSASCVLGLTRGAAMTPVQADFAKSVIERIHSGQHSMQESLGLSSEDDTNTSDLTALLDISSHLTAQITQKESANAWSDLEEAVLERLSNQPHELQSEMAAQLYEEHLESEISDDFVSELTTRLSSWTPENFELSIIAAFKLLCGRTPPESQFSEAASKLFAAIITDAASLGVLARFRLGMQLLGLILVVQGEFVHSDASNDASRSFVFSEESIERCLDHAFCGLRRLGIAKRLCQINMAMTDLRFDSEALASQRFVLQNRYSHSHAGISLSVAQSLSATATYAPRLSLNAASDLLATSSTERFWASTGILAIDDYLDNAQLAAAASRIVFNLQDQGFTAEAHEILSWLPQQDEDPALLHLQGLISLRRGEWHAASLAFERVAAFIYVSDELSAELAELIGVEPAESEYHYYTYLVDLIDIYRTPTLTIKFCLLAIDAAVVDLLSEASEPNASLRDLWYKCFRGYVSVEDFDQAYALMARMPYQETQRECLRHLVDAMCDAGLAEALLAYPFTNLSQDLETILSWKARNADPTSTPNYYKLLFAWSMSRVKQRDAAAAMYTKAKRLAKHSHTQTDTTPLELLTRECQSYLVAYNTLALVDETQRSFEVEFDVHRSSPQARICKPRIFDAKQENPKEVTLRDIEQDYILSLARLQLAKHFPELVRAGQNLSANGAIALLTQTGQYEAALEIALNLQIEASAIFEQLTIQCIQIARTQLYGLETAIQDLTWLQTDEQASTWEGSPGARAWNLLGVYLERFDDVPAVPTSSGEGRKVVLDTILRKDRWSRLPRYLVEWFMSHNAEYLIWRMIEYDRLEEAYSFAIRLIKTARDAIERVYIQNFGDDGIRSSAKISLPYNLFDQLILVDLDEDDDNAARRESISAMQVELKQAIHNQDSRLIELQKLLLA